MNFNRTLIFFALFSLPALVLAEATTAANDANIPLRAQIKARQSTVIASEMNARITHLKLLGFRLFTFFYGVQSLLCPVQTPA